MPTQEVLNVLLHNAITRNDIEAVKRYIDEGADVNYTMAIQNRQSIGIGDGLSCLANAVVRNIFEIVETLIKSGVDVNGTNNEGSFNGEWVTGATALMVAGPHVDLAKLLIEHKADLNIKNSNGSSALMLTNYIEVARLLINSGADINVVNNAGETALTLTEDTEIIKLLLSTPGIDVNINNALIGNDFYGDEVDDIIKLGADVNARSKDGHTALMLTDSISVAKKLIGAGADITIKDNEGKLASENSKSPEVRSYISYLMLNRASSEVLSATNSDKECLHVKQNKRERL